jgi:hypothetical protein
MKKLVVSSLGLLSVLGCAEIEPKPETRELSRAAAAIRALSELDDKAVAACQRAVDACEERVPDAAGVDVCERLAARCTALNERLAEERGPAVGCWTAIENCEQNTPEQAQCSRDPARCEGLADEVAQDRDKAVKCEARVQSCLTRAADLPEAALVACENIAAVCERAAANDAGVDVDGGAGAPDENENENEDEDEDEDEAEGDDDGSRPKPRPARPENGNDRGERADAGTESDD